MNASQVLSATGCTPDSVHLIGIRRCCQSWTRLGEGSESIVTESGHRYNGSYVGEHLDRVAFPLGGIGAGMVCLEGTGALSHVSLRGRPEIFNEPLMFAALTVKGTPNVARVELSRT